MILAPGAFPRRNGGPLLGSLNRLCRRRDPLPGPAADVRDPEPFGEPGASGAGEWFKSRFPPFSTHYVREVKPRRNAASALFPGFFEP